MTGHAGVMDTSTTHVFNNNKQFGRHYTLGINFCITHEHNRFNNLLAIELIIELIFFLFTFVNIYMITFHIIPYI